MKEKIADFYNGIFAYDQPELKIEPPELTFELEAGQSARGSFVVSSLDERRVKGVAYARIPGMSFEKGHFFARASRIEFTYRPAHFREGARVEDRIWLETSAGEYELPVKVFMKGADQEGAEGEEKEKEEEKPLFPLFTEYKVRSYEARRGKGRSDEWKAARRRTAALADIQRTLEEERRNGCAKAEADARIRRLTEGLLLEAPDSALYALVHAWALLREGKNEEAGWILRKYEKSRLYQEREKDVRALFLYVDSLHKGESKESAAHLLKLQKMYQRDAGNALLTAFLLSLDPQLREKTRTRYMLLERQFRAGSRNRLLYQEAWALLREDLALLTRPDGFALQTFGWAASHGLLTAQAAKMAAGQSAWRKKCSPFIVRLLKACYEASPGKETAGAVCSVYIRGRRTDAEAFAWYQKGVELDAKITNLYEYFIYALPKDYPKLLPRQTLLYFHYHNTLTTDQQTAFYCNLVRYGAPGDSVYEAHRRLLQEFLFKQLRQRRLSEPLAWLYGRCLLVEALEEDLLEALADLLFLRKLTCKEPRILKAEVSYEQLEQRIVAPLTGGCAWIPIYVPNARIALIDEYGNRYRKTVPYELEKVMDEPRFMEACIAKLKGHLGIKLYLLDGTGSHCIREDNEELAWELVRDKRVRESFRLKLKLQLLEYEKNAGRLEQTGGKFWFSDGQVERMPEDGQALCIEAQIALRQDIEAFHLLERTGCKAVDAGLTLCLLKRLMEEGAYAREQLLPLARQVFEKGVYTEEVVRFLADGCEGSSEELLAIWNAGEQFGMSMPELEEHLVAQALFTERRVCEAFPAFLSMERKGRASMLQGAYLNYLSWLDFVKGERVPEGFFDCLERRLLWEDRLSETAALSWLRQLSVLLAPAEAQKRLAGRLMKTLTAKQWHFAFMQRLLPYTEEKGRPADQTAVEYRCDPRHKVVLHYVLEQHGETACDYVTECLYPVCGGVFARAFVLFYGERLTWFFTETQKDGTVISTQSHTVENRQGHIEGGSRYGRLNDMQKALSQGRDRELRRLMAEYEALSALVEESFQMR